MVKPGGKNVKLKHMLIITSSIPDVIKVVLIGLENLCLPSKIICPALDLYLLTEGPTTIKIQVVEVFFGLHYCCFF